MKQKGTYSTVEPFKTQEDIKKMSDMFLEQDNNTMFLIFNLGISLGRRIGDILNLEWNDFYTATGEKREKLKPIIEEKTDKFSSPYLTEATWKIIDIYVNRTDCNVSENNYHNKISLQLSGNYQGKCITKSGCLKAIKRTAELVGIKYNVGNHSTRKTFGYLCHNLHANNPYNLEILQKIFNHSDSNTTLTYIGISDDMVKTFYEDVGNTLIGIMDNKKMELYNKPTNVVTVDYDKLIQIIQNSILYGQDNYNATTKDVIEYINTTKKQIMQLNMG